MAHPSLITDGISGDWSSAGVSGPVAASAQKLAWPTASPEAVLMPTTESLTAASPTILGPDEDLRADVPALAAAPADFLDTVRDRRRSLAFKYLVVMDLALSFEKTPCSMHQTTARSDDSPFSLNRLS